MNLITLPRSNKVAETGLYQPAISIILPFDPKMTPKSEIVDRLKSALEIIYRDVMKDHNNDLTALVMQKLRNVVRNLNFSTYTKSVAIYISPVLEKVLYLDIEVEPKITVDELLDIRDLVFAKKQIHQYLLMYINEYSSNIYLGNGNKLAKIKSNIIYSTQKEHRNQQSPSAQPHNFAEQRLKRIVRCSDEGLSAILNAYRLPVFVIGARKAVNYFVENTSVTDRILEYGYTNGDMTSEKEIANIVSPIVADWDNIKKKHLRQQLDIAVNAQKLATGAGNVWRMASKWTGSLLIVEENYRYTASLLESEEGLYTSKEPYCKYSHIHNAVDNIIETVLENGGDIEFVEDGSLDNYEHIVLLQY